MTKTDIETNTNRALVLRNCIPLFESWRVKTPFIWDIVNTIAFAVRPLSEKELSEINRYRLSQGQQPHLESMVYKGYHSLNGAPTVDKYDEARTRGVVCLKSGKALKGADLIESCKKAGGLILKESQASSSRIIDYDLAERLLNDINKSLWDAGYELNAKGTNWILKK